MLSEFGQRLRFVYVHAHVRYAALRAHTTTQRDDGVDVEGAITSAVTTTARYDRARRLQDAADREWAALEPGLARVASGYLR